MSEGEQEPNGNLIKVVCPHCGNWFYESEDKKYRPKICTFCDKEVIIKHNED